MTLLLLPLLYHFTVYKELSEKLQVCVIFMKTLGEGK